MLLLPQSMVSLVLLAGHSRGDEVSTGRKTSFGRFRRSCWTGFNRILTTDFYPKSRKSLKVLTHAGLEPATFRVDRNC